ncbi:alpha/beta hydrolase-fold protein [Microcoleus sp. N3A4]|uniref:alpha/beta hydrolase-fold protein n=1 Tax=Microcoleus sp. N3A4 TaxID=3055379 RepID=UPI002FD3B5B9
MKLKQSLWVGTVIIGVLVGLIYWYVFIAGAPQFDSPAIVQSKDLSFQVETFNSKAMGTPRHYGVILPPNYEKQPQQRYPVIFLLHGGHDDERAFYDKYGITSVL